MHTPILTFKSTFTHIQALVAEGHLYPFIPRSRHSARRRAYLSKELRAKLDDPTSAICTLVGRGYVDAALARWVLGNRVYGDAKGGLFLKRLVPPPPEIWEIRVTEPIVQARLFARFAAPDSLVITDVHTRGMLGSRGSQPWKNACAACADDWMTLMPGIAPFSAGHIAEYVTENCDEFPI